MHVCVCVRECVCVGHVFDVVTVRQWRRVFGFGERETSE